jgi:hypothetical protein
VLLFTRRHIIEFAFKARDAAIAHQFFMMYDMVAFHLMAVYLQRMQF